MINTFSSDEESLTTFLNAVAQLHRCDFWREELLLRFVFSGLPLKSAVALRLSEVCDVKDRLIANQNLRAAGYHLDRLLSPFGIPSLPRFIPKYVQTICSKSSSWGRDAPAFISRKHGRSITCRSAERNLSAAVVKCELPPISFRAAHVIGRHCIPKGSRFPIEELGQRIGWYFRQRISNLHDREDALRETQLRLLQLGNSFTVPLALSVAKQVVISQRKAAIILMPCGDLVASFTCDPCTSLADQPSELERTVVRNELGIAIEKSLGSLCYRQREVLRLRFGLGGTEDDSGFCYTLEEIGRMFKTTRERVRQLEVQALKKLQTQKHRHLLRYLSADHLLSLRDCIDPSVMKGLIGD